MYVFPFLFLSCRWNIWEMSASASNRHIQIRNFTPCSSAPKDHPGEALTQRYSENPGLRVSCTGGLQLFCAPSVGMSSEAVECSMFQARWCRLYESKKPSDSLNLQRGLGKAISGEVLPPCTVRICD